MDTINTLLWHANREEPLERLSDLLMELSLISAHSDAVEKIADGLTEFETYIRNNPKPYSPGSGGRRSFGKVGQGESGTILPPVNKLIFISALPPFHAVF